MVSRGTNENHPATLVPKFRLTLVPFGTTMVRMAGRTESTRTRLGPKFSEGSRLLWVVLDERGWTQTRLRRELGTHPGEVSKILYGDREPRLDTLIAAEKLGVPLEAWKQPPSVEFIPPAARAA
jgi:hypothetical protein